MPDGHADAQDARPDADAEKPATIDQAPGRARGPTGEGGRAGGGGSSSITGDTASGATPYAKRAAAKRVMRKATGSEDVATDVTVFLDWVDEDIANGRHRTCDPNDSESNGQIERGAAACRSLPELLAACELVENDGDLNGPEDGSLLRESVIIGRETYKSVVAALDEIGGSR